jgi:hypothetical protein
VPIWSATWAESIDAWLLTQPSLINARKRALIPVARDG